MGGAWMGCVSLVLVVREGGGMGGVYYHLRFYKLMDRRSLYIDCAG